MNSPDAQFKLRLPVSLKDRLDQSADRAGRSLSAEIVHRLEGSFQQGAVTEAFLKSQLLNFQLSAELLKHNPRMIGAVGKLLSGLFYDDEVRERVFAMADDGEEIAVMARDTALNKLPGRLEEVRAKMAEILEQGEKSD